MNRLLTIIIAFSSLSGFSQNTQDSVLMLNGKVFHGNFVKLDDIDNDSILQFNLDNGKTENFSIQRIFSYTSKGANNILYRKDEFKGDFLSIEETRAVTFGSFDARQTFKPHFPFWSGYALGLGASVFDTYLTKKDTIGAISTDLQPGFFQKKPSIFPFLIPAVVTISWSFPSFKLKEKKIIHSEYFRNENFYRGYHRIAKQKRMLSSLLGSVSGIATGLIIYGFVPK